MKRIILFSCVILFSLLAIYCCSSEPDYVFTLYNPERKVEIYIINGGATTGYYAKFKVKGHYNEYSYTFEIHQDIHKIEITPTNDTIVVITGTFWYQWISEDTIKLYIK